MATQTARSYGGRDAAERASERRRILMDAGLDLLTDPTATVAVRSVCRRAGLVARYFYENFTDRDALVDAVFDSMVERIATSTLVAVASAGPVPAQQIRAGIANIVDVVGDDRRLGALLFATDLAESRLAERRLQSSTLFAGLLAERARANVSAKTVSKELELTATFVVGGFAQVLAAWIAGGMSVPRTELVDHCAGLFLRLAPDTA
ncbi:TetR/AcrR family transcriptional regulator [Antrihabitans cavernicola]|uniref:TetR/AcrR family transcriptional regulator n=1 Tax=Antrihabitans cavernicola TaxID=2495913 RepID=A0A5A7S6J3_9NOCA|nr:TetR/AcrR family transcriptional regulator [Spelaeibacter cavernicola]KAA0021740.1 TetR/AcrR family transcriptional regulator [Spelaeibacter cavernicola]